MRFQNYKTLNNNAFQVQEKEKTYSKYLQRIDNIVNRKYQQDRSPEASMKILRFQKQAARKKSLYESSFNIQLQNKSLFNKIMTAKTRDFSKSEYQSIDMSGTRKRTIQKINKQNISIGMRLAEAYQKKNKKNYIPEIAKHKSNISVYLKDRKLPPLLNQDRVRQTTYQATKTNSNNSFCK